MRGRLGGNWFFPLIFSINLKLLKNKAYSPYKMNLVMTLQRPRGRQDWRGMDSKLNK